MQELLDSHMVEREEQFVESGRQTSNLYTIEPPESWQFQGDTHVPSDRDVNVPLHQDTDVPLPGTPASPLDLDPRYLDPKVPRSKDTHNPNPFPDREIAPTSPGKTIEKEAAASPPSKSHRPSLNVHAPTKEKFSRNLTKKSIDRTLWQDPQATAKFRHQLAAIARRMPNLRNPPAWVQSIAGLVERGRGLSNPYWQEFCQGLPLGSSPQTQPQSNPTRDRPQNNCESDRASRYRRIATAMAAGATIDDITHRSDEFLIDPQNPPP